MLDGGDSHWPNPGPAKSAVIDIVDSLQPRLSNPSRKAEKVHRAALLPKLFGWIIDDLKTNGIKTVVVRYEFAMIFAMAIL